MIQDVTSYLAKAPQGDIRQNDVKLRVTLTYI